jgi:hypothetical protein
VLFFDQLEHAVRFDIARPPRAGRHLTLPQNWGCGSYELPVRRALAPPRTSRSSATAPTPHPTNT